MPETPPLSINESEKQFERHYDGKLARVEFIKTKNDEIFLTHTEVDPSMEGQGIGSQLVKDVLEYSKKENLKVAPICPYIAAYIKRHPEYKSLLAPGYQV